MNHEQRAVVQAAVQIKQAELDIAKQELATYESKYNAAKAAVEELEHDVLYLGLGI